MKHFTSISAAKDLSLWIEEARSLKANPLGFSDLGKHKTLGLLFFNNSLRTRMSSQKAAFNLGMDVIVINVGQDGWKLEFDDQVIMDGSSAEHIKEAARVISTYCDIIGVRAFAGLTDKKKDEEDRVLNGFVQHAGIPVINLESSLWHPLQALADAITISEFKKTQKPKVVLSWAPHPRPLPHAVPHSFVRMAQQLELDLVITHPKGYELDPRIVKNTPVVYEQEEALENAKFVYVKSWSSYTNYGQVISQDTDWMMTREKLGPAHFMHCLPVRRNMVVSGEVLDTGNSLVIEQAHNRTYAAQLVLKKLLES